MTQQFLSKKHVINVAINELQKSNTRTFEMDVEHHCVNFINKRSELKALLIIRERAAR
ncbi:hypothetical protein HMPREF3230_00747 [Gardnerella vaginalis]|uniref:Uncharacterized protein n=1 Tax=Gardnerella vaginalis TaxID=2702 RepID=A0A135Z698_GARVA|nr:hypothetical protein HMPREF3230_00747 [Gardnerella vaginalis]